MLRRYPVIFLVPDGDAAGDRIATAVRADLPWARVVMLERGGDLRAVLQTNGPDRLLPHLVDAEQRWRLEAALKIASDIDDVERLMAGAEVT